jgi:hypothetical protein
LKLYRHVGAARVVEEVSSPPIVTFYLRIEN